MDSGVFVGIDHGGTTTTALVFDPERGKRSAHSVPMPKTTPRIDWVEHDPEDFLNTSIVAAAGALADAGSGFARAGHDGAGGGLSGGHGRRIYERR